MASRGSSKKVPRAIDHGVIGPLEPVPAAVPVHGVVPSHHIGDLSNAQGLYFLLELADIVRPEVGETSRPSKKT